MQQQQNINLNQIIDAHKKGFNVCVIVNGEYYDLII
jgi:hypothetical protein